MGPLVIREPLITDRVAVEQCKIDVAPTTGETVLQIDLRNKTDQSQAIVLSLKLTDFLQRVLVDAREQITVPAGKLLPVRKPFSGGECVEYRLSIVMQQGNEKWVYVMLLGFVVSFHRNTIYRGLLWSFSVRQYYKTFICDVLQGIM